MAEPFITAAELGDFLGRDLTGDAAAEVAIAGACAMCRTISEQTFTLVEDDVVVFDGTGGDALVLPQLPVVEVTEVTTGDDDELVDPADYAVTPEGVLLKPGGWWRRGRQNVTVTYTHGYPDDEFPADIRLVALSIAGRLLDQGSNVGQERLGQYAVTYTTPASDLTAGERAILRKHRR